MSNVLCIELNTTQNKDITVKLHSKRNYCSDTIVCGERKIWNWILDRVLIILRNSHLLRQFLQIVVSFKLNTIIRLKHQFKQTKSINLLSHMEHEIWIHKLNWIQWIHILIRFFSSWQCEIFANINSEWINW